MKFYLSALLFLGTVFGAHAYLGPEEQNSIQGNGGNGSVIVPKANCPNSNARLFTDFNDVRALIEVGGSLWQNRTTGSASYEVPVGSGNHVIFSGSIWMGGTDVNGQLKLAAVKFRTQGNDFWGGPLSVTIGSGNFDPNAPVGDDAIRDFGAATIDPDVCIEYDKFFTIEKSEVIKFNLKYECDLDPNCEDVYEISSEAQNVINNWPAHGDVTRGQDFYLAPFYDRDGDGVYDPTAGDHPWFDDILGRDDVVCGVDRRVTLFGDISNWWVFNDKGNIHTESGGAPIGMEIHAQAFSFATNDEVNKMTFYNYEMINRGTQTLYDTYFSQYVDADIGYSFDDYVGCDVSRGLGFAYNGNNNDPGQGGSPGYGSNPPAVGVDFFEGPYQDADGIDNVGPHFEEINGVTEFIQPTVNEALNGNGIVYGGIGIGYSDGIVDNERFGMRRFNYYNNGSNGSSDPLSTAPTQFYNYMTGLWRDGSQNFYGGTGYQGSNGVTTIPADYLYPGDSDPLNWGTAGVDPGWDWSETNADGNFASNDALDRRFLQSAGPFTLTPGAVNNLTVGVIFGQSFSGDAYASVESVKLADTKAQALFDNCFKILDPPSAPILEIQELENELILTISNPFGNNVNEEYEEEDNINIVDPINDAPYDKFYRFEGYQIYQMIDDEATVSDIGDIDKARLVAQCDIENDVDRLINFEFDEQLGFSTPVEKVDGENKGIRHSFSLVEDAFAQGAQKNLVNHKTYYYIAIAYAYNNYKDYDPTDPLKLDGQQMPYISSRLSADGSGIKPVIGIPHNPMPEAGGTEFHLNYGDAPYITRLDGTGNGGRSIDLTPESEEAILNSPTSSFATPTYTTNGAPINVKVIDPLSLVDGIYTLKFVDYGDIDTASWILERQNKVTGEIQTIESERTINLNNEQLIPDWGISVQIDQSYYRCPIAICQDSRELTSPIEATIEFADSSKRWLSGVQDNDAFYPTNWITSGDYIPEDPYVGGFTDPACYADLVTIDDEKEYAGLLDGIVTAGSFARANECGYAAIGINNYFTQSQWENTAKGKLGTAVQPSVDIVITSDKSKWTRCPVIELNVDENLSIGGAKPGALRASPSVDKEGRKAGDPGYNDAEATNNGAQPTGMGWFPGYAIDIETGRRVNMAFTENSFLSGENGGDMIWNPTSTYQNALGEPRFGGQQLVYVFGGQLNDIPNYEQAQTFMYDNLEAGTLAAHKKVMENLSWVAYPMLAQDQELLSTDVRIRLRLQKAYRNYSATGDFGGNPTYRWDMGETATTNNNDEQLVSVLDMINVVPNPYYAFSEYENSKLDTRVKITNLPEQCLVRIYNTSGKLIRSYKKDDPMTSIDWDLKNANGIPVAGGVYLIHVKVEGIGETVVKFFGGMRQPDLENI
ncbi:hypothetical protein SAMN05216474_1853 [Lishizhenia tianjinensis]|uniref:Por secretion system C-terminal sorting domain-containing protein n=1 Tax=Lishizhenia tianjinensis TaxID=477690 RepID=A0A1I7A348_9FLAO|nr:T9SS type A sorting domain-containing protein [Lishizhenia tianjinensis]SFT69315.1 hypothetical protein SAMN05216474_1853 [Lishizhenia tianjinensis]